MECPLLLRTPSTPPSDQSKRVVVVPSAFWYELPYEVPHYSRSQLWTGGPFSLLQHVYTFTVPLCLCVRGPGIAELCSVASRVAS